MIRTDKEVLCACRRVGRDGVLHSAIRELEAVRKRVCYNGAIV